MSNPFIARTSSGEANGFVTPPTDTPRIQRIQHGTVQQESLWLELQSGSKHVLVEARAGSGKSSSCREGMWRMAPHSRAGIRYCVFNSQNASEFRSSCPPGVDVGTIHSFGNRLLTRSCAAKVEKNKTYLVLDEEREGRTMPRYYRKSIAVVVGIAKAHNLHPADVNIGRVLNGLTNHYDVQCYGRRPWVVDWAIRVLARSKEWTELVDFDDMIWLPSQLGLTDRECEVLFVDEAQDLNPAQHAMIGVLCPTGRVVVVGDRYQSIYAFRGADTDSLPRLELQLGTASRGLATMPLTTCWRCPASHVRLARAYVPDIEARPGAPEGEIGTADVDEAVEMYRPGDMVICRSNAPLVATALGLISRRKRAIVRGRNIGDQLLNVLGYCGAENKTCAELASKVEAWKHRELSRLSELDGVEDVVESVQDRAAGLHAIVSACASPSEVPGAINDLFSDKASPTSDPTAVVFSTIHRAKGLEANHVWYLNTPAPATKSLWEDQQEKNLRYVAYTRAQQSLTFVAMG